MKRNLQLITSFNHNLFFNQGDSSCYKCIHKYRHVSTFQKPRQQQQQQQQQVFLHQKKRTLWIRRGRRRERVLERIEIALWWMLLFRWIFLIRESDLKLFRLNLDDFLKSKIIPSTHSFKRFVLVIWYEALEFWLEENLAINRFLVSLGSDLFWFLNNCWSCRRQL